MARSLRTAIAASCALAALLGLAVPVLSQSYEYRYSKIKVTQDPGGPVDPGPEEPLPGGACLTPWMEELASGEGVLAFQAPTVAAGNQCVSQTRTCSSGALTGTFEHPLCVADEPGNYADPIAFAAVSEAEPRALTRSSIEEVTGLAGPTAIARSGSYTRFRICADAACASELRPFGSRATTILPGQFVQMEVRSSDRFATSAEGRLLVGMTQAPFVVTTREGLGCTVGEVTVAHDETWDFFLHGLHAACSTVSSPRRCIDGALLGDAAYDKPFCELIDQDRLPEAFAFGPLLNQETGQVVFSDPIQLGGFDWKVPVSITREGTSFASFSICRLGRDCGPGGQFSTWSSTPGSVQAGDSIRLRARTPAALQSEASVTVTVGDFSTSWVVASKPGLACTAPWGGPIPHGQSVVAYAAPAVDFGIECQPETRTCNNGTLQGSFTHQSCIVYEQDGDPDTLDIPAITDAEPSATLTSAFVRPTGYTGPLTVKIGAGELAAFRICNTASGASCTTLNDVDKTILPGQFIHLRLRAGDFGSTRSLPVQIGPLSTSWTVSTRAGAACSAPWGGQIVHGETVNAFRAASVPYGQSCASEARTCSDGSLSGSNLNQYASCTVEPQVLAINPFPLGSALEVNRNTTPSSNQAQVTGFTGAITFNVSASPGASYAIRRCTAGGCPTNSAWGNWTNNSSSFTLSPGNWFQVRLTSPDYGEAATVTVTALGHSETFTVTTRAAATCTTPWGATLQHGASVTAFNKDVARFNETCQSASRTCNDGALQGTSSYVYAQCTQDNVARPDIWTWPDTYAPAGTANVTSGSTKITGTVGSGIPVYVTGDGMFNRNTNSSCGLTGTWLSNYTQSTIATNAYLCLRANAPSVPGQIKTLTATVGDKTVSWRLIAQ